MKQSRPAIFRGRHFEPEIIATCVRWYFALFAKLTQRRGNDGRTRPVGRPHDGLGRVSKVRSDYLSPAARKAEIGPPTCQAKTPCYAGPTDDTNGASGDSGYRSRAHATEGPIAGIPENKSGNDLDRFCFLIEDRVILEDRLKHIPLLLTRFATLPVYGFRCHSKEFKPR